MKKHGCFWTIVLLSLSAFSQEGELQLMNMMLRANQPMSFYISGGPANFNTLAPSSDVHFKPGTQLKFEIEKPVRATTLNVVTDLAYSSTQGNANYYYQSNSTTYSVPNVNLSVHSYDLALAVKWKPVRWKGVRPFVMGGILGGYMQVVYDQTLADGGAQDAGSDYLGSEGVLQVGAFGELGFDYEVSDLWGIQLSNRYQEMRTRPLDTLKNQGIRYASNNYSVGVFVRF